LAGSGGIAKERQTDVADQAQALMRTGQRITRGIWVCAGLTMAGSALSGALTFDHLKEFWGVGLATAIAVDVALWVVLTGDRQLQQLGLTSGPWGRTMRISTATMSGALNCGYSILGGQVFLAVLHAILPLLLIGLTEYSQTVGLALTEAVASTTAVVEAPTATGDTPAASPIGWSPENSVTSTPAPHLEAKQEPVIEAPWVQRPLQVAAAPIAKTPLRLVSEPAGRSPVRDTAVRWLTAQHRKGVNLDTITPAQLATGARLKIDTCRRNLDKWRRDVRSEVAI
jgi:hypothetical protein